MQKTLPALAAFALAASTGVAHADAFHRIASFPVAHNLPEGVDKATETSAEISYNFV